MMRDMDGLTHLERWQKANEHIKAGRYAEARALYQEPGALASDWRIIERRCQQAESTTPKGKE